MGRTSHQIRLLCYYCLLSTGIVDSFTLRPVEYTPLLALQPSVRGADNNHIATNRHHDGNALHVSSDSDATCVESEERTSSAVKRDAPSSYSHSFDTLTHKASAIIKCLLVVAVYMSVGAISFSRVFEKWPIIDSLYFSVVTFTTVGYGDLVPTTEAGRRFATFFSFAGIAIVGGILGYAGVFVVEAQRSAIKRTRRAARARFMALFDPMIQSGRLPKRAPPLVDDGTKGVSGMLRRIYFCLFSIRTRPDGSKSFLRRVFDALADSYYIFVPFIALALSIGKREGWTRTTSMYYAFATASTVGYGDFAPTTPQTKLLSLAFVPLAVISLADILGRIAGYFIRKEAERAEHEYMSRRITLEDLEAMDTSRSGEVDLVEFISFMLVSMQKVDKQLMDELKDLFNRMDKTRSNSIQKEDLILLAQQRDALDHSQQ